MTSEIRAEIRTVIRTVLLALLAGLLACAAALVPTAAQAHAGLVDSTPRDGATLDALPSEVTLTFTEDINPPAYVVVRHADDTALAEGEAQVEGALVRQPITAGGPGDYTLAYSVVSADGHRVTGELSFTVTGDAAAPSPGATDTPAPSPGADDSESAEDAPQPADTGGATVPAEEDEGFLAANGSLLLLGAGLVLVVGTFVVAARRRRAG